MSIAFLPHFRIPKHTSSESIHPIVPSVKTVYDRIEGLSKTRKEQKMVGNFNILFPKNTKRKNRSRTGNLPNTLIQMTRYLTPN